MAGQKAAQIAETWSLTGGGQAVGYETRRRLLLIGDDNRLPHEWVHRQACFDLAELDAKPPHLNLRIDPSQILDIPVGPQATQISGAVDSVLPSGAEWIDRELL